MWVAQGGAHVGVLRVGDHDNGGEDREPAAPRYGSTRGRGKAMEGLLCTFLRLPPPHPSDL